MVENEKTPGWAWAALGCIVCVFLATIFVTVVFVFGARQVRELEEGLKDPEVRAEKVLGVLGADTLPDGYYPMVGFSLPFVFDMAMLTSEPPGEDGEIQNGLGERTFMYFKMLGRASQEEELYDFFEGKTNDPTVLRRQRINLNTGKLLDRGVLEREDTSVLWVAHEGTFGMGRGAARDGIASLMLFQCPGQRRLRMGIWMAPAPEGLDASALDSESDAMRAALAGSAGDPEEIQRMVAGFRPCGARGG